MRAALAHYGLAGTPLRRLAAGGNVIYRAGDFVLRVHEETHSDAEIASEMMWLDALRGLGPVPVRNGDGHWVTLVGGRRCTLLRWIAGRRVRRAPRPVHFERVGRTLAALHDHASAWTPPPGFVRPRWDADGIFGDRFVAPGGVAPWHEVPREFLDVYRRTERRARAAHGELGELTLIHADLHLGNVVFADGRAHPIDFDDAGFGHLAHDFAVPLAHYRRTEEYSLFRDALLRGYAAVRPVPEEHIARLDAVIGGRLLGLVLWVVAMAEHVPAYRPRLAEYLRSYHDDLAWLLAATAT